jgi:hypothetical protein
MNNINIFVIVSIVIGIIFIILSFVLKDNKNNSNDEKLKKPEDELKSNINYINKEVTINEINNKILELNDYSNFIKQELNEKHKELLFLYQMITEKEKSIKTLKDNKIINKQDIEIAKHTAIKDEQDLQEEINNEINSNAKKILDLFKKGNDITDIAKKLSIGKGEVKLILDLYK